MARIGTRVLFDLVELPQSGTQLILIGEHQTEESEMI
jgi:hypothetical protein